MRSVRFSCFRGATASLLALGCGALLPFAMAPHNLYPCVWLSLLGFLYCIERSEDAYQTLALTGWAYGLGLYGVGIRWLYHSIHLFGGLPPWLAGLMMALMVAFMALLFAAPLPCLWVACRGRSVHRSCWGYCLSHGVLWPSLWVAFEILKTYLLTGFPWLMLGETQLGWPLGGFAPIFGVYGVSWLTASAASFMYVVLSISSQRLQDASILALLCMGMFASGAGLQHIPWTHPQGPGVAVNLIQPNVSIQDKWDPDQLSSILSHYDHMLSEAPPADWQILPEGALVSDRYSPIPDWLRRQSVYARRQDTHLIVGTMVDAGPYNGLQVLGQRPALYVKQHLVPFGEFMPFERWLRPVFDWLRIPMTPLRTDPAHTASFDFGVFRMIPAICYESAYSRVFAKRVASDGPHVPQLLLVVSEDAWFGHSDEPGQHLQGAQMRALETGKPLLFVTNRGVSAVVNAQGHMLQATPWGQAAILHAVVKPYTGETPWVRWGARWVVVFDSLLVVLSWVLLNGRRFSCGLGW